MSDHDRDRPRRGAAPGSRSDDALSPGNIVRERQDSSRSERAGNNTATGAVTSPPVDPEKI